MADIRPEWQGVGPEPDWYKKINKIPESPPPEWYAQHQPKAPWDPKPPGYIPPPITRWNIFWIVLAATLVGHVANDIFVYQYLQYLWNEMVDSINNSLLGLF